MVASSFKSRRGFSSRVSQSSMRKNYRELSYLKKPRLKSLLIKKTIKKKKKTAE
jgi:hypothetical protein